MVFKVKKFFLSGVALLNILAPSLTFAEAYLTSISPYPPTVPSGGQTTVTIKVSGPCESGGCVVNLYSQKPALFPLPSNVLIPEGSSSLGIVVSAAANETGVSQYIPIQANMNGNYVNSQVVIAKPVIGPVLSSLALSPDNFAYSGQNVSALLKLSGACSLAAGCEVKLSSNSSLLPFPSSLIISSGSSEAALSVAAGATLYAANASLSASFNGVSKNLSLDIFPPLKPMNSDGSYSMVGYGSSTRTGTGSVTASLNKEMALRNMQSHINSLVTRQCRAAIPNGVLSPVGSPKGVGEVRLSSGLLMYSYTQALKCKAL